MGLTRQEAQRCGLGHLFPDPQPLPGPAQPVQGRRVSGLNDLGQNKSEAAFDSHLGWLKSQHFIQDYRFEALKLRLAGRTWLKIDFVVVRTDGRLAMIDVKGGPWEDDAAVKTKVAADQFRWLCDIFIARRDRSLEDGWDIRPVTRTGLATVPVGRAWIYTRRDGG